MKKNLLSVFACFLVLSSFSPIVSAQVDHDHALVEGEESGILSVARRGDSEGRTVVLIPGLASGAAVWDETVGSLEGFDLRVVQVAGFAGAERFEIDGSYTDAIAKAVHQHLVDFPGKKPMVVGHSLGGYVSLKAAAIEGSPIEEVVVVDSLPFLAEMFMPGATPEQAAKSAPVFSKRMAEMPRELFDRQQLAGLSRLVGDEAYQETLATWAKASDQATVARAIGELLAADIRDEISKVNAQVTVLAAHAPVMGVSVEHIRDIYTAQYALVPNCRVLVVEHSLHFIMVDQREKFIEILKDALAE